MNHTVSKTALVFGASGLTGKLLTEQLINDPGYNKVVVFVRKKISTLNTRVEQVIFNPADFSGIDNKMNGHHVYCCIGTTRAKAGSKKAFFKIDHDLVEKIAQSASKHKAESFIVVSSIGAAANSGNFYLRTKGLMEQSIKTFSFNNISIVRPSMLLGMRGESRFLEDVGKGLIKIISPVMVGKFRKYRPIHVSDVAKVMRFSAFKGPGVFIYESDEIEALANDKSLTS